MSDSERDDLFLGFDGQTPAESSDLPMDGLLAELLGNWQDLDSSETGEPAASDDEPALAEHVSVSALMDRLLQEETEPGAEVPVEAAAPLPEAYVDLESLSIVPAGAVTAESVPTSELQVAEPEPPEPLPLSDATPPEPSPAPLADLLPDEPEPSVLALPIQPQIESIELAAPAVQNNTFSSEPEGQTDDGVLRQLLGVMRKELAESVRPRLPELPVGSGRVTERFLAFQLAGESYAVPLTRVLETERLPKATNVPGLPAFVMGVVNLRGSVLPLVDLAMLLELEHNNRSHDARILVVKPSPDDSPVALVVDALQGVALLVREELHRTPHWLDGRTTPFLEGIGSHKGRLLSVLDLDRVFAASELREQPAA
ncbi:chemotaxis protein CheW [uncultured Paludibaculum sp.]|uniref:chemotaxis protein CheW n=1 Tax=uncultured Paludibaculum sp. TaxID=1765020 RepID=UPI002AAC4838|nr:chemotaxis protein CheW [uncultured Paludibaculum sp.]